MRSRHRSRPSCACSRTLPFSSTLLFLYLILPSSSFAQVITTSGASSPTASTPIPTNSPASSTSVTSQSSPTQVDPSPPYPTSITTEENLNENVFHYYFLIIAVAVIALLLAILYIGKRKKRKAEIMRSNSQRALAQDIEGFGRFGRTMGRNGLGWPTSATQRNRSDIEEGLDERGEAPPPYVPGSKPPSLRDVERERRPSSSSEHSVGEAVELRPMNVEVEHPPGYNEYSLSENNAGITRPDTAVTGSETFSSTRRLMGRRSSSSEQDGSVNR